MGARADRRDPDYFQRLAKQQTPELFWIGCSDSRVSANVIAGLDPGEVFVHRNVANLIYSADLNCMSVLQYAVEVLQVKHVIVCGHYGCGGVRAALQGTSEGLVDHWLEPVKDLARQHRADLLGLATEESRINWLCEANPRAGAERRLFPRHTPRLGDRPGPHASRLDIRPRQRQAARPGLRSVRGSGQLSRAAPTVTCGFCRGLDVWVR